MEKREKMVEFGYELEKFLRRFGVTATTTKVEKAFSIVENKTIFGS
jgi:hypothetical protein